MVVGKQRTRNLGQSRLDIDPTMAEPKPLTYDEKKAAEAAFTGVPPNPEWTEAAQLLYARLSAAMTVRGEGEQLSGQRIAPDMTDLSGSRR